MDNKIHIVCFDIPYPPSYGGAIDVYYRIKSLHDLGVRITLHCYHKEQKNNLSALEELCEKVYYYPRKTSLWQQFHWTPYEVVSRMHPDLLPRLLQDNHPILFEGLVSCALLAHPALQNRKKLFRECNVEHDYYRELGKASTNLLVKGFYFIESIRLKYFEPCVQHADAILALAHQDEKHFHTHYPSVPTYYIPCFHAYEHISTRPGIGQPYILYHGNLSVSENQKAALYILRHLAPHIPHQIIIAGHNPFDTLRREIKKHPNVTLIESPDSQTMEQLIRDAQVHLLITFQATGIKLKLLNVLYTGKHVVVNPEMLVGTELSGLCHVGHSDEELVNLCSSLMQQSIGQNAIEERQAILDSCYNNRKSAQQIVTILSGSRGSDK